MGWWTGLKDCFHQASESMLRELCDNASDPVLIENNVVVPEWDCNSFSSDSIVFNENSIASVITECRSVEADAWYKRAL